MSNIIPFEGSKLPAFLQAAAEGGLNNDLTANVGSGFPFLSIKGKAFTLVRGDEKKLLTRKLDDGEEVNAQSITAVILKANKNFSKVWYAKSFVEGSDAKPDCFSQNGDVPDPSVKEPQAKACQVCKHNVWGTGKNEKGEATNGKACQDSRRIAIATADHLNDPMLVRIPPATLKPLAEYGAMLQKRGVPYNAVLTKIKFDPEAATPKLLFEAVGFLNETQYAEAKEMAEGHLVDEIIGSTGFVDSDAPATPAPKAKAVKEVKPAPIVVEEDIVEASPEPEERPTPKPAKKEVKEVTVDDDLDALLAELDD